jgi:FlaA1/EpsC-like NDP-sugar epimerase
VFTGTRPGEKLFEELLTMEEGTAASHHEKIHLAHKNGLPSVELDPFLNRLFEAARERDEPAIRALLCELIPENQFVTEASTPKARTKPPLRELVKANGR